MIRFKPILILLSISLIFTACDSSSTSSDGNNGTNGPVEPAASVNNPGDGATLKGEITFSVDGESKNGFDEARIYIGGKKLRTISNPSLPIEETIQTHTYNNGDYDLKAELDPSAKDTTVKASISVTFENYLVTLKTDGYIQRLKDINDAAYLFIADPQGKVLREIELTAKADGTLKFLPPSSLSGSAPDYYTFTVGQKRTKNNGDDVFNLNTVTGLKSWGTIHKKVTNTNTSSYSSSRNLTVEMSNFDQTPGETLFSFEDYPRYQLYGSTSYNPDLTRTVPIPDGSKYLVITQKPDKSVQNPVPKYKMLEDPESLPNTVSYDVSADFTNMKSHAVTVPSHIQIDGYTNWMTNAKDSFEAEGDMRFYSGNSDANGSNSGYGIWVPDNITDHSFFTSMTATDKTQPDTYYAFESAVSHSFPDKFHEVEADITFNNKLLDNVDIDIAGSADFIAIGANATTSNDIRKWSVKIPDTTSHFVYPKIADSLNHPGINYNRSNYQLSGLTSYDRGKFSGYTDYLKSEFGTKDFGTIIEFAYKDRYFNTGSQPKASSGYNRSLGEKSGRTKRDG